MLIQHFLNNNIIILIFKKQLFCYFFKNNFTIYFAYKEIRITPIIQLFIKLKILKFNRNYNNSFIILIKNYK